MIGAIGVDGPQATEGSVFHDIHAVTYVDDGFAIGRYAGIARILEFEDIEVFEN